MNVRRNHLDSLFVHLSGRVPHAPRETKIGHFTQFVVVDQDVAGGQIAMHDL